MSERFVGYHTIYGAGDEHATPYMTRLWIGRLRLHIFHRPDNDPDCHDHPWDFWTFPLTSYVEEVAQPVDPDFAFPSRIEFLKRLAIVPAFRLSYRPAEHCHRIVGRQLRRGRAVSFDPSGRIVTIVWRGSNRRRWGFLKNREGKWCWIGWRDYVFHGGKQAPCEPTERREGQS